MITDTVSTQKKLLDERVAKLTPRELDVYHRMEAGVSTRETAARLGLRPNTVKVGFGKAANGTRPPSIWRTVGTASTYEQLGKLGAIL